MPSRCGPPRFGTPSAKPQVRRPEPKSCSRITRTSLLCWRTIPSQTSLRSSSAPRLRIRFHLPRGAPRDRLVETSRTRRISAGRLLAGFSRIVTPWESWGSRQTNYCTTCDFLICFRKINSWTRKRSPPLCEPLSAGPKIVGPGALESGRSKVGHWAWPFGISTTCFQRSNTL